MENKKQENWEERLEGAKYIGKIIMQGNRTTITLQGIVDEESLMVIIGGFHAEEIYSHTEDDNLWMGIRANHFAVEIGTIEHNLEYVGLDDLGVTEALRHVEDGIYEGESAQFCLVTGNHKGTRVTTIWLLKDTLKF